MEKQRVYFVIDAKSFYASCECAERGLDPMTTNLVVADPDRTESTICLAVSPSLKALGVRNRCRLHEVPKDIPFIIAKPRMKLYIQYAANIYSLYLKYISKDDIHVYSIDEDIIDVTDYLKIYNMRAKEFAKKLMKEIDNTFHIPTTCGIGTNMYLAKIALGITAKHSPDRIGWLTEDKFIKTLWNHKPLSDFWQISKGIEKRLEKHGIYDMEGIAKADEDILYKEFGVNAELLIDHAYGREPTTIADIKNYKGQSKSVTLGQILPSPYVYSDSIIILREMIEAMCFELKRRNQVTDLIHIYVRYDGYQDGAHFSVRLNDITNLSKYIIPPVLEHYAKKVKHGEMFRQFNISMNALDESYESYDMFIGEEEIQDEKKIQQSMEALMEKYGKNIIMKAYDYSSKATQRERNKMVGGHNG